MTATSAELMLRTARMSLRPIRASDREEFVRVEHISTQHFARWQPSDLASLGAAELFDVYLARADEDRASGRGARFVGVLDDGRLAGFFTLGEIVRKSFQNAYAGWRVSADCCRKGLGTEGVRGLLALAFTPPPHGLGLHRVQANIQPDNGPSLALARRVGFREEGVARRYLNIDGAWRNHVMFALTAEERVV